jgi:PPOX class probable F420-dependent enzyme
MPYTVPSDDWWREFVGQSPARTGKLAVTRADGSPHVTPIWVVLDGDQVVFTTGGDSLKAKAIRRDPRVCICWDDDRPPFAFATVFGTAELIDDLDTVRHWATVIGGRYMGADRAQEYGERNGVPTELTVRVTVTRVLAAYDVAD